MGKSSFFFFLFNSTQWDDELGTIAHVRYVHNYVYCYGLCTLHSVLHSIPFCMPFVSRTFFYLLGPFSLTEDVLTYGPGFALSAFDSCALTTSGHFPKKKWRRTQHTHNWIAQFIVTVISLVDFSQPNIIFLVLTFRLSNMHFFFFSSIVRFGWHSKFFNTVYWR